LLNAAHRKEGTMTRCSLSLLLASLFFVAHGHAQLCNPGCPVGYVCTANNDCEPARMWQQEHQQTQPQPQRYAAPAGYVSQGYYVAPGYYPPRATMRATRANMWLLASSGFMLALTHAMSPALSGAFGGSWQTVGIMALPIGGPFACLAACRGIGDYIAPITLDGVAQSLALLSMFLAAVWREEVEVPVAVVPWMNGQNYGATLGGAW
jgi:hypothetical protein